MFAKVLLGCSAQQATFEELFKFVAQTVQNIMCFEILKNTYE